MTCGSGIEGFGGKGAAAGFAGHQAFGRALSADGGGDGQGDQGAAQLGAYTAFHAGSVEHGSNIEGMLEAVELADGNPLHLAHINAYCRGTVRPEMEETELALQAVVCQSQYFLRVVLVAAQWHQRRDRGRLAGQHGDAPLFKNRWLQ